MRPSIGIRATFALLAFASARDLRAACPVFQSAGQQVGTVQNSPSGNVNVTEASGLVVSKDHPGVLWVMNDGGTYASQRIHAISKAGAVLGIYHVSNGTGTNWEGMTLGSGPDSSKDYLYFMNVGSGTMTMYRVAEPNANVGQSFVTQSITAESFPLQYPGGIAPDCETIMNDPLTGDIYFVTKRPSATTCGVYRFPKANQIPNSSTRYTLQIVKDDITLPVINGDNSSRAVTDGTISPDGTEIVIRTNGPSQRVYAWQWNRGAGQSMAAALSGTRCTLPMHAQPQGETIAFEPDGSGYYSISEGGNEPIWYHARVSSQTVVFAPTKDAHVKEAAPGSNFGLQTTMQVSNQAGFRKYMFVQFTVSGIPTGATNISAQLRLTPTASVSRTIAAHAVTGTAWGESTLNWNNRPGLQGTLSTVTSHVVNQDSVWNVSGHVTGNGTFCVGFDTTFAGDTNFHSREATTSGFRPELVITYQP